MTSKVAHFKADACGSHPDHALIEERLKQRGLMPTHAKLVTFCKNQSDFLQEKGVTYTQVADRLNAIFQKFSFIKERLLRYGDPDVNSADIKLEGRFTINTIEVATEAKKDMTNIMCLFTKDFENSCLMIGCKIIVADQSGRTLEFSEFNPHWAKEHHFFSEALPPKSVIEFFNLEPGVNYALKPTKNSNGEEWPVIIDKENCVLATSNGAPIDIDAKAINADLPNEEANRALIDYL